MNLYIAEKPSLGKAIAAALPKPHKSHKGYIEVGNGDVVSWCIGHILEQAEPETYDQAFKKWQMQHLPIVPEQWQLKPKAATRAQLSVLRNLVKKSDGLIHAGDPDREGQLLVDEVIDYLKVSQRKKKSIKRLLINDLNLPAVKKSLQSMKSNSDYMPLSISALARSRADWLYGINLTRAYTIQGQKSGFNSVLSVGRVQTPLLGLVVKRDIEIEQFVSKPFYDVVAHLTTDKNEIFTAKWQPSEACRPYMDEDGRVLVKALAENVVARVAGQPAMVDAVKKQQKKQNAPLPYNLSALQIDAAKRFSMNAKLVLDVCQGLYEKHKLITYPRSDCRYLPVEHHSQAPDILKMLSQSSMPYAKAAQDAVPSIKSKAWNDKKVSAHHAIIPTMKSAENIALNSFEKNIYQLIVRQYIAQFYPAYIYDQCQVFLTIAGGKFKASANTEIQLGWKVLFPKSNQHKGAGGEEDEQLLPLLADGQKLHCGQADLIEKSTQPPKAYTDATLLSAMTGIARYVTDINIRKVLKDTDGLGTEATRAGIIELLFKRQYLHRIGKNIQATDIGRALILALPDIATTPDMTAQWEASLNAISEKQQSYQQFMQPLEQSLRYMVQQSAQQRLIGLPKVAFKARRKKRKTKAVS